MPRDGRAPGRARMALRALLASAALACPGCRVFHVGLLDGAVDGATDAGRDAEPDAAGDAGSCPLTRPPGRPSVDDSPDEREVVFALRYPLLAQGAHWSETGYDLDGRCSMPPTPDVECTPPDMTVVPEEDGPGGLDNVFGHQVVPYLSILLLTDLQPGVEAEMDAGRGNLLVVLRGWNGMPDDPRVDVIVAQSVRAMPELADAGVPDDGGLDGGAADGGSPGPDAGPPGPGWDGNDTFFPGDRLFVAGDIARPRLRDDNAYVADSVIVASLQDREPLSLSTGEVAMELHLVDAVLTARLTDLGTRVHAVLAGRWPALDVMAVEAELGACDMETRTRVQNLLDARVDVLESPDTAPPDAVCDAMSVGISFTGFQAQLGDVEPSPPPPMPCP